MSHSQKIILSIEQATVSDCKTLLSKEKVTFSVKMTGLAHYINNSSHVGYWRWRLAL